MTSPEEIVVDERALRSATARRAWVVTLTGSPRTRNGVNVCEVRETTAEAAVVGGLCLVVRR
jgi:hypothetical protein